MIGKIKKYFAVFFWFLILILCSSEIVRAQANKTQSDCGCHETLNQLINKVESNYAGYYIEIRGKRDSEYRQHVKSYRERARRTLPDKCILILRDFIRFFRDGHLFVQENPKLSDEDVAYLTKNAEQTGRSEAGIRRYLDANAKRLDPIEGIWYNRDGQRFGIVRDYKPGRRDFTAIMLSEGVERWQPGQVKAEFKKLSDGSYTVVFYNGRHFPLHPDVYSRGSRGGAVIRRNGLLLHIAPTTWGKAYPLKPDEQNLIDPIDPRRPMIRTFDESTVIVIVPSHSPEYAPLLREFVEKYRERILKSENLIIDIRGDEGGSTGTTGALMPFLVTPSKRPGRYWVGDETMILSSPDNIRYFKKIESEGWLPKNLVERLQTNVGKLITLADSGTEEDTPDESDVTATPFPRNVAILLDDGVVSAGEAFLIQAMKYKKVTLFGENSGGVIDYQSTSVMSLAGCPSLGIYFGYPMFAASNRLPLGGVNAKGIPPDVRIGRNVKDPFRFIVNYYGTQRK